MGVEEVFRLDGRVALVAGASRGIGNVLARGFAEAGAAVVLAARRATELEATSEEIRAQVDATLEVAFDCPGFVFAVGNHIPSNVPVENALFYFDYLSSRWWR